MSKVEDIMARKKNDDLLIEDELAAAFLNDDSMDLTEPVAAPQAAATAPAPVATDANAAWSDQEEEFPGQLAVDVYETDESLVIKARTAGVNKQDLDVSISDGILTISGTLSQPYHAGTFKSTTGVNLAAHSHCLLP